MISIVQRRSLWKRLTGGNASRQIGRNTARFGQASSTLPAGTKELFADFSASPFDEHYQMALVYCTDTSYCFSLSRFPDHEAIEIMVLDQIHERVNDLSVELRKDTIYARLDETTAAKLDGHNQYIVRLQGTEGLMDELHAALNKIFEGKKGLRIVA